MFRRVIREPLVHFTIAGALIFAGYAAVVDTKTSDGAATIRIGADEMQMLRAQFEKLWGARRTTRRWRPWYASSSARRSSTARAWPWAWSGTM